MKKISYYLTLIVIAGSIFVSFWVYQKYFKEENPNLLLFRVEKGSIQEVIKVRGEVVREFSVLTPEKADRLIGNVLSIVELVLMAIAFVSLVVGSVGIMNTMYTSVLERTKQVGIMKAVGASNDTILLLFLVESGVIGLVGGTLGVILGIIAAYIIGLIAASFGIRGLFSFASLDFLGLLVVLVITFITGIISGILPARQAARMEPAEALRYE